MMAVTDVKNILFSKNCCNFRNNKQINGVQSPGESAVKRPEDIPFYAFKSKYCPSFGKYKKTGDVYLIDRKTGDNVKASLRKETIGKYYSSFKIYTERKEAGYLEMENDALFSDDEGYVLTEGDNYVLTKEVDSILPKVLHLRSLRGDEYAGIGTALVNAAVQESLKKGKNGYLWLAAEKGYDYSSSLYRSGENPIPFYYKLGFKAVNPVTDEFIKHCLEQSKYNELPDSAILLLTPGAIKAKNKYFAEKYSNVWPL